MSTKIQIGDLLRKPNGTLVQRDIKLEDFLVDAINQTINLESSIDLLNFTDGVVAVLPMLDIPVHLNCHCCSKSYETQLQTETAETTFYLIADDFTSMENPELVDRKHMEVDLNQTLVDAIETALPMGVYCEACADKDHSHKEEVLFKSPFSEL